MSTKKKKSRRKVYKADYKLKLIKLHLEEGYSYKYLSEQTGVGSSTLGKWVKQYRTEGAESFKSKPSLRQEHKQLN